MTAISEAAVLRQSMSRALSDIGGVTVLHTAESVFDAAGEDLGAEGVAGFIGRRADYGSYHRIADRDSAPHVIPYERGAYHDRTGSNRFAMSLSFACRTTDWRRMNPAHRRAVLMQGGKAFLEMEAWKKSRGRPATALHLLSGPESSRPGASGFTYHGLRDPGRRTDPGVEEPDLFPFDEFLACIRDLAAPTQGDDMTPDEKVAFAKLCAQVDDLHDEQAMGVPGKRNEGAVTHLLRKVAEKVLGKDAADAALQRFPRDRP